MSKRKKTKADEYDQFFKAVTRFVRAFGGDVLVVGSPRVTKGERAMAFTLSVDFTGAAPNRTEPIRPRRKAKKRAH